MEADNEPPIQVAPDRAEPILIPDRQTRAAPKKVTPRAAPSDTQDEGSLVSGLLMGIIPPTFIPALEPFESAGLRELVKEAAPAPKASRRTNTGFPSVEPFESNAQDLQHFLERTGSQGNVQNEREPWGHSIDEEDRKLARWLANVRVLLQQGALESHREVLKRLCPSWPSRETKKAAAPAAPQLSSSEGPQPKTLQQHTQMSLVKASLALSKCRSQAERRAMLRQLQLDNHPDKNPDASARPVFEYVQTIWETRIGFGYGIA
eukprot:s3970_g1.t1